MLSQRRKPVSVSSSSCDVDLNDEKYSKGRYNNNTGNNFEWNIKSTLVAIVAFLTIGPLILAIFLTLLGYYEKPYFWLFNILKRLLGYH